MNILICRLLKKSRSRRRKIIGRAVGILVEGKRIILEDLNREPAALRENHKAVYLAGYFLAEKLLAQHLRMLIKSPRIVKKIDADRAIPWIQEKLAITLAEKQIEAIRAVADHKVMVVTGGPGTGKTTIINAMIRTNTAWQHHATRA